MKYLVVLLLFLNAGLSAQTYTRNYKIVSDGDEIGTLTAEKRVAGDITHYTISSDVIVRIIFKARVTHEIQASYENGKLLAASATIYVNDHIHSNTVVEKKADKYVITKDGHVINEFREIKYSSAKLYFELPEEGAFSLAEGEGILKKLRKSGEKSFELLDPGKSAAQCTYEYSSDQGLYSVKIDRSYLPDLEIIRIKDTSEVEMD